MKEQASATCDTSSNNARCIYCCDEQRCNKDVELLNFEKPGNGDNKGRRKRSGGSTFGYGARENIVSLEKGRPVRESTFVKGKNKKDHEQRRKREIFQEKSSGKWNGTVPKCIGMDA